MSTESQQARLAAAARVLAAAEESARAGSGRGSTSGSTPTRSRMPGESASSAAARLWVAGVGPEDGPGRAQTLGEAVERVGPAHPVGPVGPVGPVVLDEEDARRIVLQQLALGPRTRKQLADKLRQRECPDDVAAQILDRMSDVGLVDDAAYAETVVRTKQAGRGMSKRALAQELRSKGVDNETVVEALGSIDDESERIRAEELVAKKIRAISGLDPQVQSRRLIGMLARKGYPPPVIYAVVRDAVNGAQEHQRD